MSATTTSPKELRRRLVPPRPPVGRLSGPVVIVAVIVIGLLLPRLVNDFDVYTATVGGLYLLAASQLNILVGQAGVISMGTAAFAMLGAYASGLVQADLGWNMVAGMVIAVVICCLAGALTAAPALRLGPFAVAVVTLAYVNVVTAIVANWTSLTGGGAGLATLNSFLAPNTLWYITAALAGCSLIVARNMLRSPSGRALAVGRVSVPLAYSLGIDVRRGKLFAFTASAGAAGLAGSLYPALDGRVDTTSFPVNLSVLALLMVILGGEGRSWGPLIGATILTVVPAALNQEFDTGSDWATLIYGIFLLATVIFAPQGIIGAWHAGLSRIRSGRKPPGRETPIPAAPALDTGALDTETPEAPALAGAEQAAVAADPAPPGRKRVALPAVDESRRAVLEVTDFTKTLGSSRVVDSVSMRVEAGSIMGLIGPNGAGKTTLLNCLSGFVPADAGVATLNGQRLPRNPAARSKAGMGRTFQHPHLLADESVLDNMLVGVDQLRGAKWYEYCLRLPRARREAKSHVRRAHEWLRWIALENEATLRAGSLPPGSQRLLEVARTLAVGPRLVLLDEPAATLSDPEIDFLADIIREMKAAGIAVLLIDHHVRLIRDVCDSVTVMAAGKVIAQGTPDEVMSHGHVIEVYLGRMASGGAA